MLKRIPLMGQKEHMIIEEQLSEDSLRRRIEQKEKSAREFVKGPIPMPWLSQVAQLPGKALAVALLLKFAHDSRRFEWVAVTPTLLSKLDFDRHVGIRALENLEGAGLIELERRQGRAPRAKLLREHGLVVLDKPRQTSWRGLDNP